MYNEKMKCASCITFGIWAAVAGCVDPDGEYVDSSMRSVMDGRPATSDELYSTVAVLDATYMDQACTGTLIAPRVVLSAAHCVVEQDEETDEIIDVFAPDELVVAAGALDCSQALTSQQYPVQQIVFHEAYPGPNEEADQYGLGSYYDIALLILGEPIETLPSRKIMTLAEFDENLTQGTPLILSGYGNTDLSGDHFGVLNIAETPYIRRSDTEFWAGGEGYPDTCPGDSGGPVYVTLQGETYLIGVVSRASDLAYENCGEGGIYTLVPAFEQWIDEHSADLPEPNGEADDRDRKQGNCSFVPMGDRAGMVIGLFALCAGLESV